MQHMKYFLHQIKWLNVNTKSNLQQQSFMHSKLKTTFEIKTKTF